MNRRCVLITGSTGLASEIIDIYAKNNYNVIMTYLNHEKEAKKLEKDIKEKYNIETLCIKCDISNENDIINLKNRVLEKFNKLDVLINNASICNDTTFDMKTKDNIMKILEVNLVGTFLMCKYFGDIMYENKSGNIINISSTNGIDTYYEYSLDYDASKAGVINLTHNIASHYAPYIRVNTICSGWINTDMNKNMDIDFKRQEENKILLKRFADPKEIANTIYFVTSDDASYINDSVIRIDGGKKC